MTFSDKMLNFFKKWILSSLKPTSAITKDYRKELYEMLTFIQKRHISDYVKWPLSYKRNVLHVHGQGIVPLGVPYKLHFARLRSVY